MKFSDFLLGKDDRFGNQNPDLLKITKDDKGNGLVTVKFIPSSKFIGSDNDTLDVWYHSKVNGVKRLRCNGKNNGCPLCEAGIKKYPNHYANVWVVADQNDPKFKPSIRIMEFNFALANDLKKHPKIGSVGVDIFAPDAPLIDIAVKKNAGLNPETGAMYSIQEFYVAGITPNTITSAEWDKLIENIIDPRKLEGSVIPKSKTNEELLAILNGENQENITLGDMSQPNFIEGISDPLPQAKTTPKSNSASETIEADNSILDMFG